MPTARVWSGSGVTAFVVNTAYAQGNRIVPALADAGTNYLVARAYVWECTTAGTSDAALNPTWPASVTADTTTVTSGTATFTARNIGYSSGSTVNWTFATPFLVYAINALDEYSSSLTADILIHKTHQEEFTADTTYSTTYNVNIIAVDKDASEAWSEMGTGGWVGNSTLNRAIAFANLGYAYHYGITYRTSGSTADSITLAGGADGVCNELEKCYLWHGNTATTSVINLGGAAEFRGRVRLMDCTFRFGHASQSIVIGDARVEIIGGKVSADGKIPTTLFTFNEQGPDTDIIGFDLSAVGSNKLLFGESTLGAHTVNLVDSVIGGAAVSNTMGSTPADGGGLINVYNSGGHGVNYGFSRRDGTGYLYAQRNIVANDGAKFDGTTKLAWRVITDTSTGAVCFPAPFRSPWISVYHDGTSAITPWIEVLRLGTNVAYDATELWLELMYLPYVDSPLAVLVTTRYRGGGSPSYPDGIGSNNWFGWAETTDYILANSVKIAVPAAITPRTAGYIRARICCTVTWDDFVIDPQIRGLT